MKKYGLIGKDVSTSLSPQIHQAFFKEFNIVGQYDLFSIKEEEADAFFRNLKNRSYDGWNITHPYKKKIIPYLDECSEEAKKIGAVNTVYIKNGKSIGYNTDVEGFFLSLPECLKATKEPKILLLGAGGAAHAVWTALSGLCSPTVVLCNRTPEHAQEMCETLSIRQSPFIRTVLLRWEELKSLENGSFDMIVNTASSPFLFDEEKKTLFFNKILKNKLKKNGILYDIKYGMRESKLQKAAGNYDIFCIDGRKMLYYQALYAHICWENISLDLLDRKLTHGLELKCCFSTTEEEEK